MGEQGFETLAEASELVAACDSALTRLKAGCFWKISGDDLLLLGQQIEHLERVLYGVQVRWAGEVESQKLAAKHSHSTTSALLRSVLNISGSTAQGRVRAAEETLDQVLPSGIRTTSHLPILAAALAGGTVSAEHIRVVIATMKKIPPRADGATRDAAEARLVDHAKRCDPGQLAKIAEHLLNAIDPDGTLDDRSGAEKSELIFCARNPSTGMTGFKGRFDDLDMAMFRKAVDNAAAPRPSVAGQKDLRSLAQRQAQAFAEVLKVFLDSGSAPAHGGERPHITVVMSYDALTDQITSAQLDTGWTLPAEIARMLACDAGIVPAVLGSKSEVLDIGRSTRTFSASIRRAIALRDKGCVWDGCSAPAAWCDIHHVEYWIRDLGRTSFDNGVLLCGFHHREIHKNDWKLQMNPDDGRPELVPPIWIDRERKPRRNRIHEVMAVSRT